MSYAATLIIGLVIGYALGIVSDAKALSRNDFE